MIIIHGDDQVSSRQFLHTLKPTHQYLASEITPAQLDEIINTQSLFGQSNMILISQLFSARASNHHTQLIAYLTGHRGANIIVWEDSDVSPKLNNIPSGYIKFFPLPKYLFKFLDTFSLSDGRLALKTSPPELVLSMLVRQARKLILLPFSAGSFPPWQQAKLHSLAKKFAPGQLAKFYFHLLDLDFRHKTSSTAIDLESSLELLLAFPVR